MQADKEHRPSSVLPTKEEVFALIPQRSPFRFVDAITEVDENRISGKYTFRHNEGFYAGHFPGNPITPGVILLECMCQIGIVAHGIYLHALDLKNSDWMSEALNWTTFFSDAECEFFHPVFPGDLVVVEADRIYWRRKKLRSKISMYRDGLLVAQTIASGIGVQHAGKK